MTSEKQCTVDVCKFYLKKKGRNEWKGNLQI